jgi:hypothetical protein
LNTSFKDPLERRILLEIYVVRIYRRDEKNPRLAVGMIEKVGGEFHKTFRNFDELLKIFLTNDRPPTHKKERIRRNR